MWVRLIVLMSIVLSALPAFAQTPTQWLRQFYPLSVPNNPKCMGVIDKNQGFYCMLLDVAKPIGTQLYVIMAGNKINQNTGEDDGAHSNSGLVGFFVFEKKQGQWHLTSSNPRMPVGAFGYAPTKWTLHEFGPGRWGALNTHGDMHQGYAGSHYVILLPRGKNIQTSRIGSSFDNSGALGDCTSNDVDGTGMTVAQCRAKRFVMDSRIKIDRNSATRYGYYPLKLTLFGHKSLKKYKHRVYIIHYTQKGYVAPKTYPLYNIDY